MNGLAGKVTLITGGASGFGAGMAERFAAEGADVVIGDIDTDAGQAVAEEIGGRFVDLDVTSNDHFASLSDRIGSPVDILINNAGVAQAPADLESVAPEDFERLLGVNVRGIYLAARHLVPAMKETGGVILNIASTAGVSPRPGLTWYNATKGWVITATRSMAVELAPWGIRVNALNPVAGETPLLATFMGGDTPENRERFLGTIPLGRFSTPTDIASAACFLCSDEASMITGVALEVDGGRCI